MKRTFLFIAFYVLASIGVQAQVVGEEDSIKVLWEVEIQDIYGNVFTGLNTRPKFSQDGTSILNTVYKSNSPFGDNYNQIQKRDIETGEIVKEKHIERPGMFSDFEVTKDGKYAAFSKEVDNDTIITIVNQNTLEYVKDIVIDRYSMPGIPFKGFEAGYINSFAISPDSKYIVASVKINSQVFDPFIKHQGYTAVYDFKTGEFIKEISLSMDFEGAFSQLTFSPDGNYLAGYAAWIYLDQNEELAKEKETILFDAQTWEAIYSNKEQAQYLQFSSNSEYLVISNVHNKITLYNIKDKNENIYNFGTSIALITNDNKYLVGTKVYDIENDKTYSLEKWINRNVITYNERDLLLLVGSTDFIQLLHFNINSLITSIDQYQENIVLYPNPASDYIEISLDGSHLEGRNHQNIEIYDVLGNLVTNYSTPSLLRNATPCPHPDLSGQEGNFKIDVSQLPKGVYFVKIGDRVEKFVKL